jgi:hypothetical protein
MNWNEQPLGQMPDAEIARRTGVSREWVRIQRKQRDIPPYKGPWVDFTGEKHGRLTVLDWCRDKGELKWICECDCGTFPVLVTSSNLGNTTNSCGCSRRKLLLPGTKFSRGKNSDKRLAQEVLPL